MSWCVEHVCVRESENSLANSAGVFWAGSSVGQMALVLLCSLAHVQGLHLRAEGALQCLGFRV